ncbi:MAG: lamin tail domain-containing protein [Prolixibacteraceae bacterium]|nr:lamin tail domain-containing protein [Prolixibacteraceae bacterium]
MTLILSKNTFSQIIWNENFEIPEKGYWSDPEGLLLSDFDGVQWMLDVSRCVFSDENDYAKTVATSGGRFEVLDSDGELTWYSEILDISGHELLRLSVETGETGSGSNEDNKYINAFYRIDNGPELPFEPIAGVAGNWGSAVLEQSGILGSSLQIVIKINGSYANDKVFIDNVLVESIDSSLFSAHHINWVQVPMFAFTGDTAQIIAATYNENNQIIADSEISLLLNGAFDFINFEGTENGFYTWRVVSQSDGVRSFSVSDSANILAPVDSSVNYFNKTDLIQFDDFENQQGTQWALNQHWQISTENPIVGQSSIKHVEQEQEGLSELLYNEQVFSLDEKEFLFSFVLRNGNWDPSSSNYFYLWLVDNSTSAQMGGYAIGVNLVESDDLVSLWKMENGAPVERLITTNFDWQAGQTVQLNCMRTAAGIWTLNITDLFSGETQTASGADKQFVQIEQLSLSFAYTATRSGQLWFDNMLVLGQNIPPFIVNVEVNGDGSIDVLLNEAIETGLLNINSFKVKGKSGKEYAVQSFDVLDSKRIRLELDAVNEAYLTVEVYNITDLGGELSAFSKFEFNYALPAQAFDLVITEIMADPNPPVALPDLEYIEIYNRSNKNIRLENWTLFVRNKHYPIPEFTIMPGQYAVLCSSEMAAAFEGNNSFVAMKSFPALLNGGTIVEIVAPEGKLIDRIVYSDRWYADEERDNGGYSLERIDTERLCHQALNWRASLSSTGGTPGTVNSVNGSNPDNEPPVLQAVNILSYSNIEAVFDEPIDSFSAILNANYSLQGLAISQIEYTVGENKVSISLSFPLKINTNYQLEVENITDECGNMASKMMVPFAKAELTKGDILISEVLFNPYTHGVDFVELYNNSGLTIDLLNLKLANRDDSLNLKAVYEITSLHAHFANKTYLALTVDPENIIENYYTPFTDKVYKADRIPAYNNDKGTVVLLSDSMLVLDELVYNENMHSEWLRDAEGVSLERVSFNVESYEASNWQSASSLVGYATPGYENSQNEIVAEQQAEMLFESNEVSPNGDSYNDELVITFALDKPGYLANVYVYNAMGFELKRLMNNELIGNLNEVVYDVRDANNELLPLGTYVVLAELLHFDGPKKVFKAAFHVTDKQ